MFPTEIALVGLGNPGVKYAHTRHNAGFMALDAVAGALDSWQKKFHGQYHTCTLNEYKLHLLKPDTFMNLSGKSVQAMLAFFKLTPAQLIVIHDDLDLPTGKLRIKQGGGTGGHNGLKDIDRAIGKNYWRIRLGIDHPRARNLPIAVENYVLQAFSSEETLTIAQQCEQITTHLSTLLLDGTEGFYQAINHNTP